MRGYIMKKLKKLCGVVLIAGFMLPHIVLGSTDTAEAASGKWKQDGKKWWYSYSDGTYPKSKWEKIGGKWYHFDKWGYMQTGWQKISGKWYYFGTNGIMKTGWQKIGGKWYNFDNNGVMQKGWKKSGGKWYFFDTKGVMVTGIRSMGGKSYFFDDDGAWIGNITDLKSARIGDLVIFGKYEQDNISRNGKEDIVWRILDRKSDGGLFVTSMYALDSQPYNTIKTSVTWENCTLRRWLNGTFLNTAFSTSEQAKIVYSTVSNYNSPAYGTYGGNNTKDKIFLLGYNDVIKCFHLTSSGTWGNGAPFYKGDDCCCRPTPYAVARGVYLDDAWVGTDYEKYTVFCEWWLRTPGLETTSAAAVQNGGELLAPGTTVMISSRGVRPAMVIKP